MAQQLAGEWAAHWANGPGACCFIIDNANQPLCVTDTTYRMTAVPNNQLAIEDLSNQVGFGTASVGADGTVHPPIVLEPGGMCSVDGGQPIVLQFDFTFALHPDGTGSAKVDWKRLTHCQACDQHDVAMLVRVP